MLVKHSILKGITQFFLKIEYLDVTPLTILNGLNKPPSKHNVKLNIFNQKYAFI